MRKILIIAIMFCAFLQTSYAQTVKTVGSGGNYATLKAAFDAINAGSITGNIELQIISSITETSAMTLYYSEAPYGTYTSLVIYPTAPNLTISGSIDGPMIKLFGADTIIIDGRVNREGSTPSLTIQNTSSSSTANTSVLYFTYAARGNTVQYCYLRGSQATATSGIVNFGGTQDYSGNDYNIIQNNIFTASSSGVRPYNAIYSKGNPAYNNDIKIINNKFYNIINTSAAGIMSLIFLDSFSSNFTISGNSYFETSPITPTQNSSVYLINANCYGLAITNNVFGGNADGNTGTLTKNTGNTNEFRGIYVNNISGGVVNINGNVIKNISWSNSSGAGFYGIYTHESQMKIGTISPNIIGSSTGTGSIVLTNGSSGGFFTGIKSTGMTGYISSNVIGGITTANTSSYGCNFTGIDVGYTNAYVTNNTIGSTTTSESINASATSTAASQVCIGIYNGISSNATITGNIISNMVNGTTADATYKGFIQGITLTVGTNTVQRNTISNLSISNQNNSTDYRVSAAGIVLNIPSQATGHIIDSNTVYGINQLSTGNVFGIYHNGYATYTSTYSKNYVHSLSSGAGTSMMGINIAAGKTELATNIVILSDSDAEIYGIKAIGSATNEVFYAYYNTVYLYGTSTANKSYAFATLTGGSFFLRNNILYNARSGTASQYAIHLRVFYGGPTIDNNDYYAPNTGGILGNVNSTDALTLTAWRTATYNIIDANSFNTDPQFTNAGGTLPEDYKININMTGNVNLSYPKDYHGITRSTGFPAIGAFERKSVSVTATSKLISAEYFTLKEAFDKINDGTHTGTVSVKIKGSVYETSRAVLNASGSGSSSYTSVTISPDAAGLTLGGNVAGPVISLNGADNVTIDGRINGSGSSVLTLENASNIATDSTSAVIFENDAKGNKIQYCTIKGATQNVTGGVIYISKTAATDGNDNNVIQYNTFTKSSAGKPNCAIYTQGQAAGKENSGNIIRYNTFYDIVNTSYSSGTVNVIRVNNYTTDLTIENNSFYEPSTLTFSYSMTVKYIQIFGGTGHIITNNVIGGSVQGNTDTLRKSTNNGVNFYGIDVSLSSNSSLATLNGNVIKNISWKSGDNRPDFYGIYLGAGTFTVTGNTIGSAAGTRSIFFSNGLNSGKFYGIYATCLGTISGNTIGAIKTANESSSYSTHFYGIYTSQSASNLAIASNTIGSTNDSNSIDVSSLSTSNSQECIGIYAGGPGINSITGNTVANLTNRSTNSYSLISGINCTGVTGTVSNNTIKNLRTSDLSFSQDPPSASGIYLKNNSNGAADIINNTVNGIENNNASFNGYINGILYYGTTTSKTISRNFITNLFASDASSTSAKIMGIRAFYGSGVFANNIIKLGGNGKSTLYGIFEHGYSGCTNNMYFNTIYFDGTMPAGSANLSYCLYSDGLSSTRYFRNNVLYNGRSTTDAGAAKYHYAIYFNYGSSANLTLSNNDYYVTGTGGELGYYGNANKSVIPIVTGLDNNSLNTDPILTLAGGNTPEDYKTSSRLIIGASGTGITKDFADATRDMSFPTMGAWENPQPLPVTLSSFTYKVNSRNVTLMWKTESEENNSGFEIQRSAVSIQPSEWEKAGFVSGKGTKGTPTDYAFEDKKLDAGKYNYRLKQIDFNGNFHFYELEGEVEVGVPAKFDISQNYPNPFNPTTKIDFALPVDSKVSLLIYDISGREISRLLNNEFIKANYYTVSFNGSSLSSGVYFYRILTDKYTMTKKMVLVK